MDEDGTWYGGKPQPRQLCVRWGPSPVSEKGSGALPPQFVAHFYCGQTAGCIKMTLGTEVGLTQRKLCYMGIQHPLSKKGADPPIFGQRLLWPNGCMDQEGTWHGVRPQPRRLCVRWGPPPPQKGDRAPPQFSAISILAKRLYVSRCHLEWR